VDRPKEVSNGLTSGGAAPDLDPIAHRRTVTPSAARVVRLGDPGWRGSPGALLPGQHEPRGARRARSLTSSAPRTKTAVEASPPWRCAPPPWWPGPCARGDRCGVEECPGRWSPPERQRAAVEGEGGPRRTVRSRIAHGHSGGRAEHARLLPRGPRGRVAPAPATRREVRVTLAFRRSQARAGSTAPAVRGRVDVRGAHPRPPPLAAQPAGLAAMCPEARTRRLDRGSKPRPTRKTSPARARGRGGVLGEPARRLVQVVARSA
jgi:hypothetical protein